MEEKKKKRVVFDVIGTVKYKHWHVDVEEDFEITQEWLKEQVEDIFKLPDTVDFYWIIPNQSGFVRQHGYRICGKIYVKEVFV